MNIANIDLVRAFMQIEGKIKLGSITVNHDNKGGIEFSGYGRTVDGEIKSVRIVMDATQVEQISKCNSITEIYECYKKMEYF